MIQYTKEHPEYSLEDFIDEKISCGARGEAEDAKNSLFSYILFVSHGNSG
jgi:hypothetical protein